MACTVGPILCSSKQWDALEKLKTVRRIYTDNDLAYLSQRHTPQAVIVLTAIEEFLDLFLEEPLLQSLLLSAYKIDGTAILHPERWDLLYPAIIFRKLNTLPDPRRFLLFSPQP